MNHQQPFLTRLNIYQKERFPFLTHGLLIAAFSFSAIGYSRMCRGVTGFIPVVDYISCVFTNLALFFLLRVSDEFKDNKEDRAYRTYLPVVRGLISLKELGITALLLFSAAAVINIIWFPAVLPLLGLALAYLLLMRYEFFAGNWLRPRMHWYMISHMIIIPLADMYASGYDWKLNNAPPPSGLIFFFCVSFLNGIVLEIGRKIKSPALEEEGVDSYTKLWGLRRAPLIWTGVTALNFIVAVIAAMYAHASAAVFVVLALVFAAVLTPALLFYRTGLQTHAKKIELAAYLWALTMYLALGGIPQLWSVIFE